LTKAGWASSYRPAFPPASGRDLHDDAQAASRRPNNATRSHRAVLAPPSLVECVSAVERPCELPLRLRTLPRIRR
jgi:hypothetical protein